MAGGCWVSAEVISRFSGPVPMRLREASRTFSIRLKSRSIDAPVFAESSTSGA